MQQTIDSIINHLEFLGYKTEKIPAEKEGYVDIYIARHATRNNFVFWRMPKPSKNFILFRMNFTTTKEFSDEMNPYFNNANKSLAITKVFYDIEDGKVTLRFEAVYMGEYYRELFGEFIDLY